MTHIGDMLKSSSFLILRYERAEEPMKNCKFAKFMHVVEPLNADIVLTLYSYLDLKSLPSFAGHYSIDRHWSLEY